MAFRFTPTAIADVILIEPEVVPDQRGFFMETYKRSEFAAEGITEAFVQCNHSKSAKGILRGLHYQKYPHAQGKLVRALAGAIYDVVIDLREESRTRGRWLSVELTAANRMALYVPKGFGHGFQTLTEGAEVFYQISERFVPDAARGVRWNDPAFDIDWPIANPIVSPRDAGYPDHAY